MNNVHGWFIYSKVGLKKGESFLKTMKEKAIENEINIEIICSDDISIVSGEKNEIYYKGKKVTKLPIFVFLRTLNLSLGRHLESLGVKVINSPDSMELVKDKFRTHKVLAENNIPTPKTVNFYNKNITYSDVCKFFNSDRFIAKNNKGSQGKGVYLIENESDFNEIKEKIKRKRHFIYQEYIENTRGKDLRVYVLGGKILGCVMRKSTSEDEFRANISVGGKSEQYPVDKQIEELCLKVAKIFNFDFTGIDLLFTENGYTVCEVNSIAAFTSLNSIKDVRFSEKFYAYIKEHVLKGQKNH